MCISSGFHGDEEGYEEKDPRYDHCHVGDVERGPPVQPEDPVELDVQEVDNALGPEEPIHVVAHAPAHERTEAPFLESRHGITCEDVVEEEQRDHRQGQQHEKRAPRSGLDAAPDAERYGRVLHVDDAEEIVDDPYAAAPGDRPQDEDLRDLVQHHDAGGKRERDEA